MRRAIEQISSLLGVAAGVLLVYLVLGIGLDVILRSTTGRGIPSIAEYADIALVGLVYLSLARTQFDGGHVSSDLVITRLPPRLGYTLEFVGLIVVLTILAAVTYYTTTIAYDSFLRGEYRLGLASALIWPARWAIVIGLIAWQLMLLLRVADLVKGIRSGSLLESKTNTDTLI